MHQGVGAARETTRTTVPLNRVGFDFDSGLPATIALGAGLI